MSAHTPGPWIAVGGLVENPDDTAADICSCRPFDFGQDGFDRSEEEISANARLIAAAPDLLDALIFCEEALEAGHWQETKRTAREAIAKATKEQA